MVYTCRCSFSFGNPQSVALRHSDRDSMLLASGVLNRLIEDADMCNRRLVGHSLYDYTPNPVTHENEPKEQPTSNYAGNYSAFRPSEPSSFSLTVPYFSDRFSDRKASLISLSTRWRFPTRPMPW